MAHPAHLAQLFVVFDYVAVGAMRTVLPFMAKHLGQKSATGVGLLESLYGLGQVGSALVLGRLSDVNGRRGVLLFSFAKKSVGKQAPATVTLKRSVSREEDASGEGSGVDEGDGLRISNLQKYAELREGSPTTLHIVAKTRTTSAPHM